MNIKRLVLACWVLALVSGCAFTQPRYNRQDARPVDWGLEGAAGESAAVLVFKASDQRYGSYAAKRLKEQLLDEAVFKRVTYAESEAVDTRYIIRGEIVDLYYGGTNAPTRVSLDVRVIDRADGQTRYFRKAGISYAMKGFSVQWLNRYYVPAPLPEEIISALMREIALELAERTASHDKQCN